MAWRPTQYLLNGELDNTTPGQVTGWMRFAGFRERVQFNLAGNFHRDIRGAKIQFTGPGKEADPEAEEFMAGFSSRQVGKVGDITAGRPPCDYVRYPYLEWYSDDNGRVVIELEPDEVTVIGTPIPFIESDPISRAEQQRNMAEFLAELTRAPEATVVGTPVGPPSDPAFTHWVVQGARIVGEARDVEPQGAELCHAFVRLFEIPDLAEFGLVPAEKLRPKSEPTSALSGRFVFNSNPWR